MRKKLNSLRDTKNFVSDFLQMIFNNEGRIEKERNVIFLQGNLGAGKTTFSQFFLKKIGVEGPFTSPTFVIIKKYELKNQEVRGPASYLGSVYHLDCYRVDEASVLDLGWKEIIQDKKNLVLVEWPEKIKGIWPEKYWLLKFKYGKNKDARAVEIVRK